MSIMYMEARHEKYLIIIILIILSVLFISGCRKKNRPPYTPYTPSGPSWGVVGILYEFNSLAIDPDGDDVAIRFDWGDGDTSEWSSFASSGQTIFMNHSWKDSGFYYIKAQVKDIKENSSSWSLPFSILIKDTLGWICATESAPWEPREGHTTVIFDNKIWVIGGYNGPIGYNDVWYSSDGLIWTCATASAEWSVRGWHTSVVFDNKIWVIGGWAITYPDRPVNDVWFSSDGVNWTCATDSAEWTSRCNHSSVVHDNKIWVIGGYPYLDDVWYSTNGLDWVCAMDSAHWQAREGHTSVVFDNKIWVLGGLRFGNLNDVWYSTDGQNWICITDSAGWSPRFAHTTVVFDNKIWILGGDHFPDLCNDVWYTINGLQWIRVTSPISLWQPRDNHTSIVFDNKIWVIGGNICLEAHTATNDVWFWDGQLKSEN
jgi:hypothetical protein